jgi:thioredoxin reductase
LAYSQSAEVAIVGCGPAGIAAAIQLKRMDIDLLVFERHRIGGLLANANLVENYPGYPAGIPGAELVHLMEKHLKAHAAEVIFHEASKLRHSGEGFTIAAGGEVFKAAITVLATGTKATSPDGVRIEAAARPMVLHEIVPIAGACDEEIVIVGAGDAAFDYAINLGRRNRVTILNRTDHVRCLGILRERADVLQSIAYLPKTVIVGVTRASQNRLSIECRSAGKDIVLEAHHLVFAIGRKPELGLLSGPLLESQVRLCEEGLLYLIGDVTRGQMRQTAIAVGDGVRAAIEISDKLRKRDR